MNSHSVPPSLAVFGVSLLTSFVFSLTSSAQSVTYDVRVKTGDKARAISGSTRQGSFGAPSINDKGNIAYACVLSGENVNALRSYSVVFKKKGKRGAVAAVQSGYQRGFFPIESNFGFTFSTDPRVLPDSFRVFNSTSSNVVPVAGTPRMFRISRDVAITRNDRIAFAGQMIEDIESVSRNDEGSITNRTYSTQSFQVYGESLPAGGKFTNIPIALYLNYDASILTRTISVNKTGAVPFDGLYEITDDEDVAGFGFNSPSGGTDPVATVASNVIGLPYFTTFTSFSDPIISNGGICFVVADISDSGDDFDGIWQGSNLDLQPVVVKQTAAPGGGTFSAFDGKVGPSPNSNFAAFIANLSGGTANRGVYRATKDGTSIIRVAAVGDAAPETSGNFQDFELASVNDRGQVALLGTTNDSDGNTRSGIWLSDPKGENLKLIVLEGTDLTVKNTEKRITEIAFSPVSGLNKKGQVAFTASFTDRTSAVIIAQ